MAPREDDSVEESRSVTRGSSSGQPQEQIEVQTGVQTEGQSQGQSEDQAQSSSPEQHIATILELLHSLASRRTNSLLHPEQTSGPMPSEPVHHVQNSGSGPVETERRKREEVISKIEMVFQNFAEAFSEEKELAVILSSRRSSSGPTAEQDTKQPDSSSSVGHSREIRFPGSTRREGWTFLVVMRILDLIHEALVKNLVTTKRDIFYKDPGLFVKQSVVDQFVDDIACTFGIERASLNVVRPSMVAAAKGLVLGPLKITRCNGSVLDCADDEEGMLIPNTKEIRELDMSGIRWILVIEKEATFRSLATSKFWQTPLMGKGLLITAKGYPDISTRYLLRLLSIHPSLQDHQRPPLYALVDFDPDGIAIVSTYKYGSIALVHENAQLRVPGLKRLGIRSKDITTLSSVDDETGLLRLTARDRRRARRMLGNKELVEEGEETEWRRDLQYMLMLNVKAEIQILSNQEGGLERWLEREILAQYLAGQ